MGKSNKSKSAFLYSLQVWLSSALIGPIQWYFYPVKYMGEHSFLTFFQFYGATLLFVFMFSLPSFLLLFVSVAHIDRRPWQLMSKKFVAAGCAVVLAIVPLLVIADWDASLLKVSTFAFLGTYIVPLLVAIFLIRWPQRQTVYESNEAGQDRNNG